MEINEEIALLKKRMEGYNKVRNRLHELECIQKKEEKAPLIGKCYKYENSFGGCGDGETWFEYYRVVDVSHCGDPIMISIQSCASNLKDIRYSLREEYWDRNLIEISEEEYNKAFNEILSQIKP